MAKYIIRFDDACPMMDKKKWARAEKICDKYNIKPIVAVVPNNKDKKLIKDEFDNDFWSKVRSWQKKGYYIALHGYEHLYITQKSGFLPFNKKSEFAGLSYEEQVNKIKKAWEIFQKEKIKCNIWVAPSHTFDKNTLKALKEHTSIEIVSDGISLFPFKKYGFNWIPQQVWRFRKMPFGVWTGCFHPNEMTEKEFLELEKFVANNYYNFIPIEDLDYDVRFSFVNVLFKYFYLYVMKTRKILKRK